MATSQALKGNIIKHVLAIALLLILSMSGAQARDRSEITAAIDCFISWDREDGIPEM